MSFLEVSPFTVSRTGDSVHDIFHRMHVTLHQIENDTASVRGFHRGAHCEAYITAQARFSDAARRLHILLNNASESLSRTGVTYHSQDDTARDNVSGVGF